MIKKMISQFKLLIKKIVPDSLLKKRHLVNILSSIKVIDSYKLIAGGIQIKISKMQILLRNQSHSDINVFKQIFENEEYKVIYEILNSLGQNNYSMIDAGANIGLTTLYLSDKLANFKSILIEPDKNNFDQLIGNIGQNDFFLDATCINKALSSSSKKMFSLANNFRDELDWSIRTLEDEFGTVESIDLYDLVNQFPETPIDLLKMDIEGGEFEIFSNDKDCTFLKHFKVVAIEIHDEVGDRKEIETQLARYNFTFFNSGELTIGINNNLFRI
jgi:FkbM family methyltransferase